MLLADHLHEKSVTESQDGQNFDSAHAIYNLYFALELQLCSRRVLRHCYPEQSLCSYEFGCRSFIKHTP